MNSQSRLAAMCDQANRLRQMVHQGLTGCGEGASSGAPAPRLLVVAGAKGGVGTTTLAVNLAIALAAQGRRTLLVDANLQHPDAGVMCGIHDGCTLTALLAGHYPVEAALARGPAGIHVLCGAWANGQPGECSAGQQRRLLEELASLGASIDDVVIDAGHRLSQPCLHVWQAADRLLLVTSVDALSVMDAYASIKLAAAAGGTPRVSLVINRLDDVDATGHVGAEIGQRLRRVCHRFLAIEVEPAGWIPEDAAVLAAAGLPAPFVLDAPDCPAARHVASLAHQLCAQTGKSEQSSRIDSTRLQSMADMKAYCR